MSGLAEIWGKIERNEGCDECPLKGKTHPLILDFDTKVKVNVMVITEGPNVEAPKEFITSLANYPTFMYLQTLFKGNFVPRGDKPTAYWTHVRKYFLKNRQGKKFTENDKKALEKCSNAYLKDEIKALKPKLIVAVGRRAADFLSNYNRKLRRKLKTLMTSEKLTVKIDETVCEVVVLPHPSGRSRTLASLEKDEEWVKIRRAIEKISEKIAITVVSESQN